MYIIFALPLNMTPCAMIVVPSHLNNTDFSWLTLVQLVPELCSYLSFRIPTYVLTMKDGRFDPTDLFIFFGYWALLPAAVISVVVMIRIQVRVYRSFKFLKFNWRTLLLYPLVFVPVMLLMGPLFLLWSYLKHGLLNRPAGHVMVTAPAPSADLESGAAPGQPLSA